MNHASINRKLRPLQLAKTLNLGLMTLLLGSSSLIAVASEQPTDPFSRQQFSIAQVPASSTVVYVNPTLGTDSPDAGRTEGAAYRTITYALQQARPGTVIQLAPGSYIRDNGEIFPLTLPPGVILRGNEARKGQTVLISGSGTYVSPTFAGQNVTIRADRDSEIRGVTVTNPFTRGTGIWVESTNPTIANNTFANSLRDGVFVTGTGAPRIEDNIFSQNQGNGVAVARTARGEIRGNLFQNTGFGIAIGDTAAPLVAGNQIVENTDGIVVSNSARPILRNNLIENNTRDGVVAIATAQPDLGTPDSPGNNIIRNNTRHDVYNATRGNTLVAVGNNIDPSKISGPVDFVAAQVTPPGQIATAFRDVQGHWAQAYIEALAARDIISGFPDGTFRPTEPVTRAQFAAIVNKAFNPAPQRPATEFTDVRPNFWGYQAIQTAARGGFLAGYPGQVFRPEQRIPRVQALVSLANGLQLTATDTGTLSLYQDAAQIPNYAIAPVAAATQRQIVVNYPNQAQLHPTREATRAEVAAFVYQALVNAGRAEAIPSPYVVRVP